MFKLITTLTIAALLAPVAFVVLFNFLLAAPLLSVAALTVVAVAAAVIGRDVYLSR